MGCVFKWKIEKVILLPFGALTIFNADLNRPMLEEFFIVIMGPIFQVLFTFFLYFIYKDINILYYSFSVLAFNLVPIFPLDGSKLFNLFLNRLFSFKKSHFLMILVSLLMIFALLICFDFNLIFMFILSFLFIKIILEIKNHNGLFNRFLLERYLKDYHFKKYKKIYFSDESKMKRDYNHMFFNGFRWVSEREVLKKRFDFRGKV